MAPGAADTTTSGVGPGADAGVGSGAGRGAGVGAELGVGVGHPERVCAGEVLSSVERALARELRW
ncbi:DUF6059 family protein [Streptomyces sp. NA04227]|uniref:DUF6059 family protein n=1 Tax=Streptomyces sp. NA04227 TaxID=2742136 RepID=UPI0020CA30B9